MSGARAPIGAGLVALVLLLYVAIVWQRAMALVGSGRGVAVALGTAILVIPLLTLWFLVREVAQALAVDRLTRRLAAEGALEVDDLPRSPGGRIDRAVARERFGPASDDVAASPQDWRAWYRLGWAYDAAGDRRRARGALRQAVRLERVARRAAR